VSGGRHAWLEPLGPGATGGLPLSSTATWERGRRSDEGAPLAATWNRLGKFLGLHPFCICSSQMVVRLGL